MKNDKRELNDNELNNITGAGESFNNITIGNIEDSSTMGVIPSSKTLAETANEEIIGMKKSLK